MKKYLSGIVMVMMAIVLSAFTVPKSPDLALDSQIWYDFSGTNEAVLSNYTVDSDNIADCPTGGTVLCEMLAYPIAEGEPNAGKPDFSRSHTARRKN